MSIAGLPDRTVCPIAIQILAFIGSTSTVTMCVIGLSSVGLASTRRVSFGGSSSRVRLTGLCS